MEYAVSRIESVSHTGLRNLCIVSKHIHKSNFTHPYTSLGRHDWGSSIRDDLTGAHSAEILNQIQSPVLQTEESFMLLYQPLLKTITKGKCNIKEAHGSPRRSLGNSNVAQIDAGLYTKDNLTTTTYK